MAKPAPTPTFPVTVEHWYFNEHTQIWDAKWQMAYNLPARARRSYYDTARLTYKACFVKRLDKRANHTIWASRAGVVYLTVWAGRGATTRKFRLIITPRGEPSDEPRPLPVLEFEETSQA